MADLDVTIDTATGTLHGAITGLPDDGHDMVQWDEHLNGDDDGLGLMRGIIAGLTILAVLLLAGFLVCWAVEAARGAIMASGTVAQVTAPDFDLERTLVEAGQ